MITFTYERHMHPIKRPIELSHVDKELFDVSAAVFVYDHRNVSAEDVITLEETQPDLFKVFRSSITRDRGFVQGNIKDAQVIRDMLVQLGHEVLDFPDGKLTQYDAD